jgi:hypothetical protein
VKLLFISFFMPFFFDERLLLWNSFTQRKRLLHAFWANYGKAPAWGRSTPPAIQLHGFIFRC